MLKHVKRSLHINDMVARLNALANQGVDVEHMPLNVLLDEMIQAYALYSVEGTPQFEAINSECKEVRKLARKEVNKFKRLIPIFEDELRQLEEQGKDSIKPIVVRIPKPEQPKDVQASSSTLPVTQVTETLQAVIQTLEGQAETLREDLNMALDNHESKEETLIIMHKVLHLANALSSLDTTLDELKRVL